MNGNVTSSTLYMVIITCDAYANYIVRTEKCKHSTILWPHLRNDKQKFQFLMRILARGQWCFCSRCVENVRQGLEQRIAFASCCIKVGSK